MMCPHIVFNYEYVDMKSAKLLTVHGPNVSVVVDYADTVRA